MDMGYSARSAAAEGNATVGSEKRDSVSGSACIVSVIP
jgi:hypothetical protein